MAAYEFNGRREIYPDIRLVYWAGGNPFHHHQDLNRLRAPGRSRRPSSSTTAGGRRPRAMPTSCCRRRPSLERNDVGGSSRDPYVFAMHRAIDSGRRRETTISRSSARSLGRLGYEDAFTEGRDEMAWCRWIYERVRASAPPKDVALPGFQQFWAEGFVELPPPDARFRAVRGFPPRSASVIRSRRRPDGSRSRRRPSPASTTRTVRRIRPGCRRRNGSAARTAERWPLHLVTHQPAGRLHSQLDPAPVSRGQQGRRTRADPPPSADADPARHQRRRRGARVQRSRRLPRAAQCRRRRDAAGRGHGDRRLVRSGAGGRTSPSGTAIPTCSPSISARRG